MDKHNELSQETGPKRAASREQTDWNTERMKEVADVLVLVLSSQRRIEPIPIGLEMWNCGNGICH